MTRHEKFVNWAKGRTDAMGQPFSDWRLLRYDDAGQPLRDAQGHRSYETQAEYVARQAAPASAPQLELFA